MPYNVSINLQSPYLPGTEVLDYPEDWNSPTERRGKFYRGRKIEVGRPLSPEEVPHHYRVKIAANRLPDIFLRPLAHW